LISFTRVVKKEKSHAGVNALGVWRSSIRNFTQRQETNAIVMNERQIQPNMSFLTLAVLIGNTAVCLR
jgi:hypothetical protein